MYRITKPQLKNCGEREDQIIIIIYSSDFLSRDYFYNEKWSKDLIIGLDCQMFEISAHTFRDLCGVWTEQIYGGMVQI